MSGALPATAYSQPKTATVSNNRPALNVAVAANFRNTATQLFAEFEQQYPVAIRLSTASTGTLYAQTIAGAPFDLVFMADHPSARRLVDDGRAQPASLRIYARGTLILTYRLENEKPQALLALANRLCSPETPDEKALTPNRQSLLLAIANPQLAPYGRAALQALGNSDQKTPTQKVEIIKGNNVLQAQQFFNNTLVDAALVSLSQVIHLDSSEPRCRVKTSLYAPILQSMVVVNKPHRQIQQRDAIKALYQFLDSPQAMRIMQRNGYHTH